MKISTRAKRIKVKLDKLNDEYMALQEECTHPNATKKYGASTGNYDKSQDCYWTTFYCPDCDKKWTVDGSV